MKESTKKAVTWTLILFGAIVGLVVVGLLTGEIDPSAAATLV